MLPIDDDTSALRQLVDSLQAELNQERQRSRSRDLARVAMNQLEVDPESALLVALEANSQVITYESRDALQQAVSASHLRWLFTKPGEARIQFAYFAEDSRHIITFGNDGVLRWWDFESRQEIDTLTCCTGTFEKVFLSPLHDRALAIAFNSELESYQGMMINLSQRKVVAVIADEIVTQEDLINSEAFFSQDGSRVAFNTEWSEDLCLWDTTNGALIMKWIGVGRCHGLDRDGRRALMTKQDGSAAIMELDNDGRTIVLDMSNENARPPSPYEINRGRMPFSNDGTRLATGSGNRLAFVWDTSDGRLLHILGHETPCHISSASISPSGRLILVQQNDRVATEIWEAETGKHLFDLPNSSAFHVPTRFIPPKAHAGAPEYAMVGLGASHLSVALPVNQVTEWHLWTGAIRSQFRLPGKLNLQRCFKNDGTMPQGEPRREQDDISGDANWVLRLENDVVRVFARLESVEPNEPTETGSSLTADRRIGYTTEGQTLVDSPTNQDLVALGKLDRFLFSPDGRHLVTTSNAEENPLVYIRDAQTGQLRFTITDFTKRVMVMQYQPGQTHLLIGCLDHTIGLWSLETGAQVARIKVDAQDGPGYVAVSSADATKVALVTGGRIHVWHIDQGEILQAPTRHYIQDPRFSADGSWLLAMDENVARIWDTATMKEICVFPYHFANVVSGDLSPDKRSAATLGLDEYLRLWDPQTGQEITRWKFKQFQNYHFRSLRFAEDGKSIIFPGGPRFIVDMEDLISLAKSRVFRELLPEERHLFLGEG